MAWRCRSSDELSLGETRLSRARYEVGSLFAVTFPAMRPEESMAEAGSDPPFPGSNETAK